MDHKMGSLMLTPVMCGTAVMICNDLDGVLTEFDKVIGLVQTEGRCILMTV